MSKYSFKGCWENGFSVRLFQTVIIKYINSCLFTKTCCMLHSCLLICPYLYFLWHYQTSTVKTQHLAKYNDLAKNLYWLTHWLFQWTGRKWAISGETFMFNHTQRFHPTQFSLFLRTPAKSVPGQTESRDILIHSLVLWHTHRLRQGTEKPQLLMFVFVQKRERERERGWKRQTTQKKTTFVS